MRLFICLVTLCMFAGCGLKNDISAVPPSPLELTANPRVAMDFSVPVSQLKLRGVGLGDSHDAIRPNRILSEDALGWIICRDACRYRLLDGKIVTLGLWDQKSLDQLSIKEQADIEKTFGKAEKVEEFDTLSTKMTIYRFDSDQRRANWDRIQNRLAAINVGAAVAIVKPATADK